MSIKVKQDLDKMDVTIRVVMNRLSIVNVNDWQDTMHENKTCIQELQAVRKLIAELRTKIK